MKGFKKSASIQPSFMSRLGGIQIIYAGLMRVFHLYIPYIHAYFIVRLSSADHF